jgi:hypothetical protein
MMKKLVVVFVLMIAAFNSYSQKAWNTRNAKISFVSVKNDEVQAVNNEVNSRLTDKGEMMFSLLMKGFKFEMAEMQEHFNDEYVQSNKFPNASFKGQIINIKSVNFAKDGLYKVAVKGNLTLHGVTKPVLANGTVEIKKGKVKADSKFTINMNDYKIDEGIGGSIIGNKIAITVTAQYQ